MKRVLSVAILLVLVGMAFAQKKAVKEAKKLMEQDKLSEARAMIKPALTDPETANDPETWKVAGDIENKAFDNEFKKQYQGKQPNDEVMYAALYDTWTPYITADSLAQIPDKKGKVTDKYRKDISAIMKVNHLNFINGGVFYYNKNEYRKAADYFIRYWDMPSLNLFDGYAEKDKINTNDTIFQTVKYYAARCAILSKEHSQAIGLLKRIIAEPFMENKEYPLSDVYELLSSEYLQVGDSTNYLQTLREGTELFPKSKYFVPNLINEMMRRDQMDDALKYLDQAILNSPDNSCELYSVKADIYSQRSEYAKSFESYEKALVADENCERALSGLAVAYILQAQELKGQASQTTALKAQKEIDQQANDLYKKAYPLLEKLKTLLETRKANKTEPIPTTQELKGVLYKLQNAYYNLNMGPELDAVTKAYEDLDKQ
jgi:tetratricopeptide (TPR) repeat protein